MSITKEQIEERKKLLEDDVNSAKQRMAENEKQKTEDTALLNALAGAIQQCDIFLRELDNDKSEMAGDDGNDSLAVS